jgi:UDP-N-acetylglucosamine acyltransferase
MLHATAIVDSKAELDANVEVGPYSIIRQNVSIGAGTVIGPHVIIEPYVNIGQDCHIFQYAAIGAAPQSLKF